MSDFEEGRHLLQEVFAKYAINSIDEAEDICESKGIYINKIVSEIKKDVPEAAILAFILGTAIAIKKDTKLASYVAYDIGEGIQALCEPETEAFDNSAGLGIGRQVELALRGNETEESMVDFTSMLGFMGLTKEELIEIISAISKKVEEAMQ